MSTPAARAGRTCSKPSLLCWRVLLVALCVGGLGLGGCEDRSGDRPDDPFLKAPDFELTTLDGRPVRLENLRGKIVILDFWATWCAPCEVQMPILDAIWRDGAEARQAQTDDLMIVGLSVDTDPAADVIEWVEERGFEYPIAITDQDLAMKFGVLGFPTLVIVDPDGGVHTRHTGVLGRPEIEDAIQEIRLAATAEG